MSNGFMRLLAGLCVVAALVSFTSCKKEGDGGTTQPATGASGTGGGAKPRVAYITNGIDPFWDTAIAGARVGAQEFGLEVEAHKPAQGVTDQNRIVEALLTKRIAGIAISPIDAAGQVDLINTACEQTKVITHDSDAPQTKRLCFIGVNNYNAGRQVGRLVKEAMPQGGSVMIFVGRLEQLNAQERRQGVIDELLDRPQPDVKNLKFDPQSGELKGAKYTILDTRTDGFKYERAKGNAEEAITRFPDLGCMVGLFAYNPPQCLEAIKGAGRVGKIKLVGFDEQDATLEGIRDGSVYGTVSQQPFRYGRESMRILAGLIKGGDDSELPPGGYLELQGVVVKKDNVDTFWKELKEQQAQGR
jgi:ribose transport system substrate-binding protein